MPDRKIGAGDTVNKTPLTPLIDTAACWTRDADLRRRSMRYWFLNCAFMTETSNVNASDAVRL